MTFFSIKTFTTLTYQEFRNGKYNKMVDGLWYKHTDETDEFSELDIVVNFNINYNVDENELRESNHLLQALAKLPGEKSNISLLTPKLKEKERLLKELLLKYEEELEEEIVMNEKSNLFNELNKSKSTYREINALYSQNRVLLRDNNERIQILYKTIKDNMGKEEYENELERLRKEQEDLLKNENEYKIEMDILKEEISFLSKSSRKPLTNQELEKRVHKDKKYKMISKRLSDMSIVLDYIEKLDKSQDEKSLVTRAIKGIVQNDMLEQKNTIRFQM